jgi:extracellular elastinolytic metalloproteinase
VEATVTKEIDVRTTTDRTDPQRREALHDAAAEVSATLAGDHTIEVASFDAETGNPAVVVSRGSEGLEGDYVSRALAHVQHISRALGFEQGQPPEYLPDPQHQTTSTGAVAVHLRQAYKGIPIYDMAEVVRFEPDGRLAEVAGRSFAVASEEPATPVVTAEQALRAAADHVAASDQDDDAPTDPFGEPLHQPDLDLGGLAPAVRSAGADRPDLVTVFDAPPFAHAVTVSLVWFPLDGGLRLGWQMRLQVPDGPVYRVIVDAGDQRILLCHRLTNSILGRCEVVLSAGGPRRPISLPLAPDTYGTPIPADLPPGFPDHWLIDGSTLGASVRAILADGAVPSQGTSQGGEVVFAAPPADDEPSQLVVNLFALCSVMHDVLYLLGFREADGNFQVDNHGRGGRPSDPVSARVHPGTVWGTANMGTPADGNQPTMNMGLVSSTDRHTALDPDVVYHEYTHGLTNRLIGGPMNDSALDAVQSGGMGEGWSDFVACTMLGKTVVGDWVVDRPAGIRRFRYDDQFPDTFGNLGSGRYVGDNVHAIGEVWCATLMSLSRRLGTWPTAQIVVDALKLTAANPSFLAARDAIVLAAGQYASARGMDETAAGELVRTVWEVFARFGMGPAARTNGATLTGIVADFQAPAAPTTGATVQASATPALAIPDDDDAGVTSTLVLPAAGPIGGLSVAVDITHTYRGDLEVALEAPDGRRVLLHQRTGGRLDDLKETWSSADHQGLATLHGLPAEGQWSLHVSDRAKVDVGVLNAWSLEADVAGAPQQPASVDVEAVPGLAIPDNNPTGVTSDLVVVESGNISSLTLDVDITHTFVGDLEVTLAGPDGRKVIVHKRTGGGADNIITTFRSDGSGPLAGFVGAAVAGTWRLTVADRAGRDVGKLNRWRLLAALAPSP